MNNIPRPEYPRPDLMRENWQSLNGTWQFSFDQPVYDREILVPFCYQSKASGVGDSTDHDTVWYRRTFSVDAGKIGKGRLLLHFGAVDYEAGVWVNGIYIGSHRGGHTPFSMDITDAVQNGENELTVRAEDTKATDQPRGKQSWTGELFGCWYTATTGIWQSVWLEYAGEVYLKRVKFTPDARLLQATCEVFLSSHQETQVDLYPSLEGAGQFGHLGKVSLNCKNGYGKAVLTFQDLDIRRDDLIWKPDHPNLIDVKVVVNGVEKADEVQTYFGMRSTGIQGQAITLNNEFLYQRLILDQGYWPDSLLTPPSDEAIIADIKLTLAMGFNGARKHQKIEDPRYYYWADKLGLLVWGEMPSAYSYNDTAIENTTREMVEFVERDFNHPCIIAWVPVNESWGVRGVLVDGQQQDYTRALYYLLRSLDGTRLISGNDGWEQTDATDICAVHDYSLVPATIGKYDDMEGILSSRAESRLLFADGSRYEGQPVIMTEYGGIAFAKDAEQGWGYYENVADNEAFLQRLEPITTFLIKSRKFAGFCYTQLTDVMQEVNGLLTPDRQPKLPVEELHKIFSQRG